MDMCFVFLEVEVLGHMVNMFTLKETVELFSKMSVLSYILINVNIMKSPFVNSVVILDSGGGISLWFDLIFL